MAISDGGLFGDHRGRVGKVVYYVRRGKQISRTVGVNNKPPSEAQLRCRQEMKVVNAFCKSVKPFILYGFARHIEGTDLSQSNVAISYNKLNALKGVYPNIQIDYAKASLSEGPLLQADASEVAIVPEGLKFNWYVDPNLQWPDFTDQAMMLAYFPSLNKTVYQLFGAERSVGTATLKVNAPLLNEHVETYIAFISADRKQVSDSVYAGGFNIPD
jgi:hypothetical protein